MPVLLYLVAFMVPISMDVGPIVLSSLRAVLLVLIVPLSIQLLIGRFGKIYLTDILFILHVMWMVPVFALNNPSMMVQQVGSTGVEFWGGYVLGRAYIRTPETFLALCRALMVMVFISMPFALYETVSGNAIVANLLNSLPAVTSVTDIDLPQRMGFNRVQFVLSHPIHYGLFCSIAFSFTFVALRSVLSTGARYFMALAIALSGFTSLSSGAFLAITLQFGLIIWTALFATHRYRWRYLVGLFFTCYVTVDLLSNRSTLDVFMSYATFSPQTAYWRSLIFEWGMKTVWSYPTFGIGWRDWERPWFMNSASVDNFWLLMAMRFGIPGFLMIATGYVLGVARIMRRNFEGDLQLIYIRRAWVFTFIGLSFTLSTVHVWTYIYSFTFFIFGAGFFLITQAVAKIPPQRKRQPGMRTALPMDGPTRFAPTHRRRSTPP